MPGSSVSYLLSDLSWVAVRDHLVHDQRLIVPVGACDQYGPHLPLGSATLVVEALAAELSRDFGVLRAPALRYGINLPGERLFAGAASLREKTLHRALNELLAAWEDQGFEEFILMTAQLYDPHVEALATVAVARARIRVVEVLALDLAALLGEAPGPQHGGEILTSLMLYLHPDKVNLERAEDFVLPEMELRSRPYSVERLPVASSGSIGRPTRASAELGRQMFEFIVQKVRSKIFLAPQGTDE